jgi:plasmid maintenance system antidote protein VapI
MPDEKRPLTCSQLELAEILGITDRRVRQLTQEGTFEQKARGVYEIGPCVQAYFRLQQSIVRSQYQDEKTHLTKITREKAEIELAVLRGEMHRGEDVKYVMNTMLGNFRDRLLSLPLKLAPQVIAVTDLMTAQNMIKAEVYEALTELSNYSPELFNKGRPEMGHGDVEADE